MDNSTISDRAVSYLRTIVPIAWGWVVTWILTNVSAVSDFVTNHHIDLNSLVIQSFITSVAIAAWYVIWRAVEPHIPDWLTRLVLGSAKAPQYAGTVSDGNITVDDDNTVEVENDVENPVTDPAVPEMTDQTETDAETSEVEETDEDASTDATPLDTAPDKE